MSHIRIKSARCGDCLATGYPVPHIVAYRGSERVGECVPPVLKPFEGPKPGTCAPCLGTGFVTGLATATEGANQKGGA